MTNWNVKDADLTTLAEINERINSIYRQLSEIESRDYRKGKGGSVHIDDVKKRHAKIVALNARLDALHTRQRKMNPPKEPVLKFRLRWRVFDMLEEGRSVEDVVSTLGLNEEQAKEVLKIQMLEIC
jgi:hypothetical protein